MSLSERIEPSEVLREATEALEESHRVGARGAAPALSALPATRDVRVMTYNILAGGWPRVDALETVMRDARADIIGVQEAAAHTLTELASRLGMFSALSWSRRGSPTGLLSRWPLCDVDPHADGPLLNGLLEAVVEPEGAPPLRIFVTHLAASYTAWRAGEGQRLRELSYILERMRAASADGVDSVLMGDFNSLPPDERLLASRLLLHTADNDARRAQGDDLTGQPGVSKVLPKPLRPLANGLVDLARQPALGWIADLAAGVYVPRAVVRRTRAAGYTDLYTATHPDARQREMSCPSQNPAGRIDYIFANPTLASRLATCELLGDTPTCPVTLASDHRPMLATLALPRVTP